MKKEWSIVILIVIVIGLLSFSLYYFINNPPASTKINDNTVTEIIDGDTFVIGNGETVRLICVDTPEQGESGYEEAKDFLSFLVLGREVRLEKDVSERDQYGRLLRYVYIGTTEIFVNKEIVQQGYGKVFPYGNDTKRCGEIGLG